MQSNSNFSENINTVFTKLENYVQHESMMGTPMTIESKTLVPIVSVSLGYGTGAPKNNNNNNSSTSLGLGAKIVTDAVVVIDKEGVSLLPVSQKTNFNDMMDKIPTMINNLKGGNAQQNQQSQGNQNQQQNNSNKAQ